MKTPRLQGQRMLEEVARLAAIDRLPVQHYTNRILDALEAPTADTRRLDVDDLDTARQFVSRFAAQLRAVSDLFACAANPISPTRAGSFEGWTPSRAIANLFGGVVPVDVARENIDSVKQADAAERYNVALDHLELGSCQTAMLVPAITGGAQAHEIFVTTHIVPEFQAGLAATLADPRFARTPRLFLVDGAEPLTTAELIAQASVLRKSGYGEVEDVKLNCSKFHLAGGYANACLSKTAKQLIQRHAESANAATLLDLTFHAEHIFDTGSATLAGQLRATPATPRAYALAAQAFLKSKLPADYSLSDITVAEEGGRVTLTASFASVDTAHRGEMRVIARTAVDVLSASAA